jgi:hypothetical protein
MATGIRFMNMNIVAFLGSARAFFFLLKVFLLLFFFSYQTWWPWTYASWTW